MLTREARGEVTRLVASEDTVIATREFIGEIAQADVDKLKIAATALLVRPLTEGISNFLNCDEELALEGYRDGLKFCERIGREMSTHIGRTVIEDPAKELMDEIQAVRKKQNNSGPGSVEVYSGIEPAATHAIKALYIAGNANRNIIVKAQDPELTDSVDLVNAIMNSTSLPLAETRSHFQWLGNIENRVIAWADSDNYDGQDLLTYDSNKKVAKLTAAPGNWLAMYKIDPAKIKETPADDVRVGCPASFDPELIRALYVKVIQEKAVNNMWEPVVEEPLYVGGIM